MNVILQNQNEISSAMSVTDLKLKIAYQETGTTSFQACKRPQHNMAQLIRMMKVKPCMCYNQRGQAMSGSKTSSFRDARLCQILLQFGEAIM